MIPWLLVACEKGPVELDPDRPGDTGEPTAPAAFVEPPLAVDSDPDPDRVHVSITAAPHELLVGGERFDGFAYDGSVPGPTIEAVVGQTLVVDVHNDLPVPTTVHWHGLHVPAAMDGAGWPMPEIAPGETFTATFVVEQTGTFWYHPHFDTAHQLDRGLYGVLVVRDPADPPVDRELVLVLDTFGEPESAEADPHLVDPTSARWAVNGVIEPVLPLDAGTRVRARLLNASNAGLVFLEGQRTIAHDQGLLAAVEDGALILAPGDRAEVEWDVGEGFEVLRRPATVAGGEAWGPRAPLLTVTTEGGDAPEPLAWPMVDEPPSPDPGTTDLRFLLSGSAELGWEINGDTFPDVTIPRLALGAEVVLEVRNASPSNHPFHVHGHELEVLSIDGVAPARRTVEDTIDVPIRGIVRLKLVADNPGTWMTHCHVLPHAEGGMMTLLEVE